MTIYFMSVAAHDSVDRVSGGLKRKKEIIKKLPCD